MAHTPINLNRKKAMAMSKDITQIRLDVGTNVDLLSSEVTSVYFWQKGPDKKKRIIAQTPTNLKEVFFYDPYEEPKELSDLKLTNNTAMCYINITKPGNYTFWLEVLFDNKWVLSEPCYAQLK
jgi:hypothetical protein